jgi:uncharacterized protein (TIGR00251 family)
MCRGSPRIGDSMARAPATARRCLPMATAARLIEVSVKPNARVSSLEQSSDGTWLARLKSPPVDGKANAELIALLAHHFACRKSQIVIRGGASGRRKWVEIDAG